MPCECWGQSCCQGMGQLPRGPSGFPLPEAVQLCHGKDRLCLFWVTPQQHSVTSPLPCHPEAEARWARGWPSPWTGQQVCCCVWGPSELLACGSCLELPLDFMTCC